MFYNINMVTLQRKNLLYTILSILVLIVFFTPFNQVSAEDGFPAPAYFNENEILTNQVEIAKIINDCSIYSSQSIDSNEYPITQNSFIIVLKSNIENYDDISYVLYEDNNNLIFGYITKSKYEICQFENINTTYNTFYKNVKVYKYPTLNSVQVGTINDIAEIYPLNNCAYYVDGNNNSFYAISYNDGICYVNSNDLAMLNAFEPEVIEKTATNDNLTQMTAFFVIIICLFIATIFICIKIIKKES